MGKVGTIDTATVVLGIAGSLAAAAGDRSVPMFAAGTCR